MLSERTESRPTGCGQLCSSVWFGTTGVIAFITEVDPIHCVLNYIGEPTTPPQITSVRAPPMEWDTDFDQTSFQQSGQAEPIPEFEYDQTVTW